MIEAALVDFHQRQAQLIHGLNLFHGMHLQLFMAKAVTASNGQTQPQPILQCACDDLPNQL